MPIQMITVKGEKMYRYGDSGKLYNNRADAEKQAAAIHSSGYREKSDNKPSTKKKGADGAACWEGYRYAGTINGKDKCVKMKK